MLKLKQISSFIYMFKILINIIFKSINLSLKRVNLGFKKILILKNLIYCQGYMINNTFCYIIRPKILSFNVITWSYDLS